MSFYIWSLFCADFYEKTALSVYWCEKENFPVRTEQVPNIYVCVYVGFFFNSKNKN